MELYQSSSDIQTWSSIRAVDVLITIVITRPSLIRASDVLIAIVRPSLIRAADVLIAIVRPSLIRAAYVLIAIVIT